jgi:hypothetical protein
MKTIVAFRTDAKGLYLDLADQPYAIGINRVTKDILLDEGDGDDRYNGAVIFVKSNPRFEFQLRDGALEIWLEYGQERTRHFIGSTPTYRKAAYWIKQANQQLGSSKPLNQRRIRDVSHFEYRRSQKCGTPPKRVLIGHRVYYIVRKRSVELFTQLVNK